MSDPEPARSAASGLSLPIKTHGSVPELKERNQTYREIRNVDHGSVRAAGLNLHSRVEVGSPWAG